jgi:hypothetical protein
MQIVRNNAQYEDDEVREWMEELANQIEKPNRQPPHQQLMNNNAKS